MPSERKPRIFVASSTEALGVAYAVQKNLRHDGEVTLWNQGVFQLSATAVESLEQATPDFGVFVFAADDIAKIRGEDNASVRDNVIFELGLFVGRLGRKRCFILIPDGVELRIPTDLIGMTPARYEVDRSDNNNEAACHEVRLAIQKLGFLLKDTQGPDGLPEAQSVAETSSAAKLAVIERKQEHAEESWSIAFWEKDYEKATRLVQARLDKSTDEKERVLNKAFLALIEFHKEPSKGVQSFEALIAAEPEIADYYTWYAYAYSGAGILEKSLSIMERGIEAAREKSDLIVGKGHYLRQLAKIGPATDALEAGLKQFPENERLYLELAEIYLETKELKKARNRLVQGIQALPNNTALLSKYAGLLSENGDNLGAVAVYHRLLAINPSSPTYQTLLGNAYLLLDLNNLAYDAYRTAHTLSNSKEGWIIANIGNLLKNRGLFSPAIERFNEALLLEPDSQYSHERLANAITEKTAEEARLTQLLKSAPPVFAIQDETEVSAVGALAAKLLDSPVPS